MKTQATIDGLTVEVNGESVILLDGRSVSEKLVPCELPEFAPYRFPSAMLKAVTGCVGPACRVEITGRTIRYREHGFGRCVRVLVTFIGDGEPNTTAGGWLMAE